MRSCIVSRLLLCSEARMTVVQACVQAARCAVQCAVCCALGCGVWVRCALTRCAGLGWWGCGEWCGEGLLSRGWQVACSKGMRSFQSFWMLLPPDHAWCKEGEGGA